MTPENPVESTAPVPAEIPATKPTCTRRYNHQKHKINPITGQARRIEALEKVRLLSQKPGATKMCPRCSARSGKPVEYPANLDYFYLDPSKPGGLSALCKACKKDSSRVNRKPEDTLFQKGVPLHVRRLADVPRFARKEPIPHYTKQCSNLYCGRILPATPDYFALNQDEEATEVFDPICLRCRAVEKYLNAKDAPTEATAMAHVEEPATHEITGPTEDVPPTQPRKYAGEPVLRTLLGGHDEENEEELELRRQCAGKPGFDENGFPY